MSDANKDVKFYLKLAMNKQKTKVLFAEADSDFVDVLLSFLTLPLGTIVKVLAKHYGDEAPTIGSLTTLYNGLSSLDISNFWTEGGKRMLLDPISSFGEECRKLKLDITDAEVIKYFCCEDNDCGFSTKFNISMYYGIARCDCGKRLIRGVPMRDVSESDDDGGVFVASGTTFIISDDLLILPNEAGSVLQIISKLGITDTDFGEIKNVTFGFNQIMDLLKGSFLSRTPLTDIILNNGRINFAAPCEPRILLPKVENKGSANSNKMVLKVIVQKSTNKLLFVQAEEEFIDTLFSFLTIPLGAVECLLDDSTSLSNIDNLYKSVVVLIDQKYFECAKAMDSLIVPKLRHGYISKYQILPLEQEKPRKIYYYRSKCPDEEEFVSLSHDMGGSCVKVTSFKFPKGNKLYVKGPRMYTVDDDLSVSPSSMTAYLSSLSGLKIPLSDVTELVLHVGSEEALSILKASLVSKTALSNGLNHLLRKQPKQEH